MLPSNKVCLASQFQNGCHKQGVFRECNIFLYDKNIQKKFKTELQNGSHGWFSKDDFSKDDSYILLKGKKDNGLVSCT